MLPNIHQYLQSCHIYCIQCTISAVFKRSVTNFSSLQIHEITNLFSYRNLTIYSNISIISCKLSCASIISYFNYYSKCKNPPNFHTLNYISWATFPLRECDCDIKVLNTHCKVAVTIAKMSTEPI